MIVRAAYISIYLKIVLVLWLLCACPFLDEQFAVAQNKAYFDNAIHSKFENKYSLRNRAGIVLFKKKQNRRTSQRNK